MKKVPERLVVAWLSGVETFSVSPVTVEEMSFGLRRKSMLDKEMWLRQFLDERAEILPITDSIARWSGEKRAELAGRGIATTMADSLIAATAQAHGLVLCTRNTRDFASMGVPLYNPFSAS